MGQSNETTREGKGSGNGNGNGKEERGNSTTTTTDIKPNGGKGNSDRKENKSADENIKGNLVESPNVVTVEIPNVENVDKPKRKYKPREKKENNSNSKSKDNEIGKEEISSLLMGTFSLISMKGGEHWNISKSESDQIAQPLSNILKKLNIAEQVASFSDGAMLLMAVVTITLPRIILTKELAKMNNEIKKKEIIENGGRVIKNGTTKQESGNTKEVSGNSDSGVQETKSHDGEFSKSIYATSPM